MRIKFQQMFSLSKERMVKVMGVTRAMENERRVFEIPVQYSAEQAWEQDAADLMPAQESIVEEVQIQPIVEQKKSLVVPIQVKVLLTLEEAAAYTGLGMQKLRNISNFDSCGFVLWNGSKRLFKREKLKAYLESAYSI